MPLKALFLVLDTYCLPAFTIGVTVQRSSGEVNIFAKRVVSDAGVINTFKHLLPREIAQKSRKKKFCHWKSPDPYFIIKGKMS